MLGNISKTTNHRLCLSNPRGQLSKLNHPAAISARFISIRDEFRESDRIKIAHGKSLIRQAMATRRDIQKHANRIVVKVGSAIITHDKGHLSAPRLASIVEQIAQLQQEGRQMLLVSSGAVAFGKRKIHDEVQKSKSIRETLSENRGIKRLSENRAAAAVGQSSLMSFYENLFQQYDCKVAQVLVTTADFKNESSKIQLRNTILDLLRLNIVPIVNTNDAVESNLTSNLSNGEPGLKHADMKDIIVEDNDSLAAILAVELESDLMILLSNVNGIYSGPPDRNESRFLPTYTPLLQEKQVIEFGSKSSSGLGGMQAKIKSALWALKKGTSVVICNGQNSGIINRVVEGQKVGTFFTEQCDENNSIELASLARSGSKKLQQLDDDKRSDMIKDIAKSLDANRSMIFAENERDLKHARASGLESVLLSRLKLNDDKLDSLIAGIGQIADQSRGMLGKVLKQIKVSDTLDLSQIACPIGVLMVIFESRPDCLPQISALSLATGNGLLLKGGKEAHHSNTCLYQLVQNCLRKYDCTDAIHMVDSRDQVNELVTLGNIDLIIPRGSNQLVRSIQDQAKSIPVLGHAEGICHVYLDSEADFESSIKIVVDSKCNYPAACNAMETLLIHESLCQTPLYNKICEALKEKNVRFNIGARLAKKFPHINSGTSNYEVEYSSLECTIETVDSVEQAIDHINKYGSGHTDSIVTSNPQTANLFEKNVQSACTFVNCSTRFADGYRFGLGAEVGISTAKIHARGPAGMESLMLYRWLLRGSGDAVGDYVDSGGNKQYVHEIVSTSAH